MNLKKQTVKTKLDDRRKMESTIQTRVYIFVRYPNAPGPCSIIKILEENGSEVCHSYDINDLKVKGPFDIIIIPGGTAKVQQNDLGASGIQLIKEFVADGGGYVGLCAGAYLAAVPPLDKAHKPGIGLIDTRYILPATTLELKGKIHVQLRMPNYKKNVVIPYHNGAIFEHPDETEGNNCIENLGYITKLVGINWNTMLGKSCLLRSKYGKGYVVVCGPHPEASQDLVDFTYQLIMLAYSPKK